MSDKAKIGVAVNINTNSSSEKAVSLSSPGSNAPVTHAHSPFCIAVMGDFSGRLSHSKMHEEGRNQLRPINIDRDNFEDVMSNFNIRLNLNLADKTSVSLELNELDDFHPDELYEKLESFSKLRNLRRRLKSSNGFADAAAEIQSWLPSSDVTDNKPVKAPLSDTSTTNPDSLTENILDDIFASSQELSYSATTAEATNIDKLIKSIVAPYAEPATDPRQDEMIAIVDKAIESHMRNILHHPDFQAMEAAWQSLYFLIKRLETDSKLKISVLDITKRELQDDLAVDDISSSSIYKLFCDTSEGDLPWSILLGNYRFTDNIEDVLSLANIGSIAHQANAAFIAAANETLAGCESLAKTPDYEDWNHSISEGASKAWTMLRQSSQASYIGLALPRFLLRLPYGKKSKPIDSFVFEEIKNDNSHESFLWGNAAFIKTECIARNFKNNGWGMRLNETFQTDNLPTYYYLNDGETVNKPIAEIMLTEKGGEILREYGLTPLWSVRNLDSIRSTDYYSIAENSNILSGRWK